MELVGSETKKEFEARMHFIRVFDTFCSGKGLVWTLYGDFLRHFFSGIPTGDSVMTFNIKAANFRGIPLSADHIAEKMNSVVKTMEMIGMVKKKTVIVDTTLVCDIEIMNVDQSISQFPVFIYCGSSCPNMFSCDSIGLTSTGLIVTKHPEFDYFNNSTGVALLQRLFELKTKTITPLISYVNEPEDRNIRLQNVSIISRENVLIKEGFSFAGPHLCIEESLNDNDVCPICLEDECKQTKLQCGHAFCLTCVTRHMQRRGSNHSKCPFCRSPIMLTVV